MKKINKYKAIRIIAGIVFAVSFCCWGYTELLYLDADVTYKDLEKKAVKTADTTGEPITAADGQTVQTAFDGPILEIDHNKLMDVNNDYICWLSACGNQISYPVVRGRDNEQYLHHTFFGDKSFVGSIFMDYRCYLEDFHTLIYGHSMHDGSMFRKIADFTDPEKAKANPYFYIYRGDKMQKYEIYSVYDLNGAELVTAIGEPDDEQKAAFIAALKEKSLYTLCEEPTVNDKFVSLVTCDVRDDSKRVVVTGVRR